MKESNAEGLTSHSGPELCGGGGNNAAEALAGGGAGVVLSPEIRSTFRVPTVSLCWEGNTLTRAEGEHVNDSAGSETHCMHRRFLCGNRETLRPATADCAGVRTANSKEVRLR
jgi:hypothetical protein